MRNRFNDYELWKNWENLVSAWQPSGPAIHPCTHSEHLPHPACGRTVDNFPHPAPPRL